MSSFKCSQPGRGGLAVGLRPAWGEALLPPGGRTVGRVRLRASCGDVCSPSRPWELRMRSRRHPGPRVIPSRAEQRKGLWVLRPAERGPGEEQESLGGLRA